MSQPDTSTVISNIVIAIGLIVGIYTGSIHLLLAMIGFAILHFAAIIQKLHNN